MADEPAQPKVTSHNQRGGVTAHTVNSGTSTSFSPTPQPEKSSRWMWVAGAIGGVLAAAASIVAILEYFGVNVVSKP